VAALRVSVVRTGDWIQSGGRNRSRIFPLSGSDVNVYVGMMEGNGGQLTLCLSVSSRTSSMVTGKKKLSDG